MTGHVCFNEHLTDNWCENLRLTGGVTYQVQFHFGVSVFLFPCAFNWCLNWNGNWSDNWRDHVKGPLMSFCRLKMQPRGQFCPFLHHNICIYVHWNERRKNKVLQNSRNCVFFTEKICNNLDEAPVYNWAPYLQCVWESGGITPYINLGKICNNKRAVHLQDVWIVEV
jgi:hypothetical protein